MTLLAAESLFGAQAGAPGHKIRVVLIGDSTVNDGGGWGPGFRASFGSGVEVANLALNGRSSKSFRAEGAWAKALTPAPQYVLMQFGHNDVPGKGPDRETEPATTYRDNMVRYIEETRAVGAVPVLVTSIVRRNFTPEGKIAPDSLEPYVEEARKIAREKSVPLIDLYSLTVAQAEKLGPEGCARIGARTADGAVDTTHLGPQGQMEIGAMAARELVRVEPALAQDFRDEDAPVRFVVAADGSGDSKTIQYAIDHAPRTRAMQRLIIEIRPGIYKERVIIPQSRPRVTFLGADAATTIVTAGMSAAAAGGTFLSATVTVEGTEFEAENVTFENTFGVGSQAVAISVHSDRAVFRKCRFLGMQDTLYAAWGRQYYRDCYIEGHVDFIFGDATAVFDDCEIRSKGAGYIAADSRDVADSPTGFVFRNCRLTKSPESKTAEVYLARPWRPCSRVVYLNTWMDSHIRPEGWDNWGNAQNEKTAVFLETGSSGPGAAASARRPWSRQISKEEAAAFEPREFLKGLDLWNPAQE